MPRCHNRDGELGAPPGLPLAVGEPGCPDDVEVGVGDWLGEPVVDGVGDALVGELVGVWVGEEDDEGLALDSEGLGDEVCVGDSEGLSDWLWVGDSDGLWDGGGDWDWDEVAVAVGGIGGGGGVWGAREKIRMTMSRAMAASRSINSQDARMVSRPPRSRRPGHGRGHTRVRPGAIRSDQCRR